MLTGTYSSTTAVNHKNTVINNIPSARGIRAGSGSSSGGSGSGSGSGEPIVIQNHLFMDERQIASIVSNVTPKVDNKRQRHYMYVNGTAKKF